MSDQVNVTTTRHFEIFKDECRRWIEFFGLKGWRIEFEHQDCDEFGSRAWFEFKVNDRAARLNLAVDWSGEGPITDDSIRRSAFHEVCELLLGRIRVLAEDPKASEREIGEEIHAVIRTLENTVFASAVVDKQEVAEFKIDQTLAAILEPNELSLC